MNLGLGIGPTFIGPAFLWSPSRLRIGTRDVRDLTVRPNRLFSDTAGTTLISGPGAEVAAMRDSRGVLVATQATSAARLKYAVQPAVGVRNTLRENMAIAATGWSIQNASGGAGALTVVDDAAAIAALSLPPGVRAYRVDNSTGTGPSRFAMGAGNGTFDSAVNFTLSAFIRSESGSLTDYQIRTGFGGYPSLNVTTEFVRYSRTSTQRTSGTSNAADTLWVEVPAGAVALIVLPQHELGLTLTAPQAVRTSGFDVSEAGVRAVHRLAYDGVDDFMDLATAWTSGAAYTLAAAHNLNDSAAFNSTAGTIFGNTGSTSGRFFRSTRSLSNIETDTGNRRAADTASVSGRVVDLARMIAGGEAFYRNGVLSTSFAENDGDPEPVFNTLGRSGTGYATGSFFSGLMVSDGDTPLTVAERQSIQRYMEYQRGTVA